MRHHVITGLPRSCSTLLCNILNQNPDFYATDTSIVPALCQSAVSTWSNSPDFKGNLYHERERYDGKVTRTVQGLWDSWHTKDGCFDAFHKEGQQIGPDSMCFDKSRWWLHQLNLFFTAFPEGKVIITIRDLREVFASCCRYQIKYGLYDSTPNIVAKTLDALALSMFSTPGPPQITDSGTKGLIGRPLMGIHDLFFRGMEEDPRIMFVKGEDLCKSPKSTMAKVYTFLDAPPFEHNFESVENVTREPDFVNMHHFPHEGSGKVESRDSTWEKAMSEEIANQIVLRNPWFFEFFNYLTKKQLRKFKAMAANGMPAAQQLVKDTDD
jgi:sulfotransferase